MKWIFYIGLLSVALLFPVRRTDVGKLQPVELVMLYRNGSAVVLETDTGDRGEGVTVMEAIRNLKQTTPGKVYLDTAEYLLVSEGEETLIWELEDHFGDSVRICSIPERVDPEMAAPYLDNHLPAVKLCNWNGEEIREILVQQEKRYELKNKEENEQKTLDK